MNDALDDDDISEIADAIVDMAYVHYGTMLTYGVHCLDTTYSSNMDIDDCFDCIENTNELIANSIFPHVEMQKINVSINTLAKRLLPEGKFEALFNEVHRKQYV